MADLAGKVYFTVQEAAEYAGISVSHWRARIQREFPPDQTTANSSTAGAMCNASSRVRCNGLSLSTRRALVPWTWLSGDQKLTGHEPRKILTDLVGRIGCAARLMPAADVLGIAEGIETALSAALIDDIPVWAALNTSLLARFEPPANVTTLRVYADRDKAGLTAALKLLERLPGPYRRRRASGIRWMVERWLRQFAEHLTTG
jgi:hypothetical protein